MNILSEHIGQTALVYIDDIVIYSQTKDAYRQHVQEVLDTIDKAGLTLKQQKCVFGRDKVNLLGYVISAYGNISSVCAIRNMAPPENLKELQRFLGLTGYYRQTIPSYAQVAEPLVQLTRKGELWRWGDEQQAAFNVLKKRTH